MPLTADDYRRYVDAFNARLYDRLMSFFAEDVVLEIATHRICGRQGIKDFYAFFHAHVRETVTEVRHFMSGRGASFADVVIRFEGIDGLTAEMLAERGYERMTPVPAGGKVEIEFFIVYETPGGGPITHIRGAVFEPATD